jgi:hypothetical protein
MAPQDPGYQTPVLRQAASGLWVIVDELQNAVRDTQDNLQKRGVLQPESSQQESGNPPRRDALRQQHS